MTKTQLQQSIEDIKNIKTAYEEKEGYSPYLSIKIKDLEMELLDQFYSLINKPVVKKTRAKTQPKAKKAIQAPTKEADQT